MLDIQTWIEKTFAHWTYRQLAIASSLVVAVVAALQVWQIYRASGQSAVGAAATRPLAVKRWLNRDDPRGFLAPSALGNPGKDDGRFDIAWISGSPISIRKAPVQWQLLGKPGYEMTDVLARYLVSLDDRPVRVQEFLLQGTRSGDMRRAVLFAAHQPEIDAYLVEANTVWVANDFLQFTQSRQKAQVLGLPGATWFDYGIAARLIGPHEIGLQMLSGVLPAVRDRFQMFSNIVLGRSPAFPFSRKPPPREDGAMLRNWVDWFFPHLAQLPIAQKAAALRTSRSLMLMSDLGSDGVGMRLFAENIKTLSGTGKPTIVYLPPLNSLLKDDPATVDYVAKLTAALQREFAAVAGPNVELHTETVWADPQPGRHLDILHLDRGQGVIDMMVGLLEKKVGKSFKKESPYFVYQPKWPGQR